MCEPVIAVVVLVVVVDDSCPQLVRVSAILALLCLCLE